MTEKRKSPCTAGTVTGAKVNTQDQYSGDFSESQAEEIFRRDFRRLCIGALAILAMYVIARIAGWIG